MKRPARLVELAFAGSVLLLGGCDSKPERPGITNPLDPENPITGGDPYGLVVDQDGGEVTLTWSVPSVTGLQGFSIFRKTEFDSVFTRVDTAGGSEKSWTDPAPAYFARSWYRIAAIGSDGTEADTSGRGPDSTDVPPFLSIAGGASRTAIRGVTLTIGAEETDRMILSGDPDLAGASWEAFDTTRSWTLPEGFGWKRVYLQVARDGGDTSAVVVDSIETAETNGSIVLAGGDSTTGRARVDVALSGDDLTRVVLGTDSLFPGDSDSTIAFDSLTTLDDSIVQWTFGTDLGTKRLYAQFWNEFGAEAVAVDSIRPDDLEEATILLAGGDSVAGECEVTLSVTAVATLMNISPTSEFDPGEWTAYRSDTTWTIGDTADTYDVWVQLSNDFVNLRQSALHDDIVFVPVPLAVAITSPTESTFVTAGDTTSIAGDLVAASCRATPDSVSVWIGDSLVTTGGGDTAWSLSWIADENVSDTLPLSIVAAAIDEADSSASDTVTVLVIPTE